MRHKTQLMKKIAIVIGHTSIRKGVKNVLNKKTEYEINSRVANALEDVAAIYRYNPYTYGYTRRVKELAKKINQKQYSLVLELHFNAAESTQANGAEALYYFANQSGRDLAEYFGELMETKMGIKNRFAKPLYSAKQRGFAAVYYPKPTTLILEPFFGSNVGDCFLFNEEKYIEVIKELIKVYRDDF